MAPAIAEETTTTTTFNAKYPTAKAQWSFTLSTVLDKPVEEVIKKLGRIECFEKVMKVNPVCKEYKEVGRDWVGVVGEIGDARLREEVQQVQVRVQDGAQPEVGGERRFERIRFEGKDSLTAFWGLLEDVIWQRGTYVWDEGNRVGLWEVTTTSDDEDKDKPGMESWLRKVITFKDGGDGKRTKVEEFVEGYSKEKLRILEGFAKRYTRDLHR
jgi:hypothetical protein